MKLTNGHASTADQLRAAEASCDAAFREYERANAAVTAAKEARRVASEVAEAQRLAVASLRARLQYEDMVAATPPELTAQLADTREAIRLVRVDRHELFQQLRLVRARVKAALTPRGLDMQGDPERAQFASEEAMAIEHRISVLDIDHLAPLLAELARLEDLQSRPPRVVPPPQEPAGPRLVRETLAGQHRPAA